MALLLSSPQIAMRDCSECRKWVYGSDYRPIIIAGQKQPRKPGTAPCELNPREGCPKGTWQNPVSLTPENEMAYLHWCECRATNDWPRGGDGQIDAVVRRNASIISAVQSLAERRMSNAELALSLMGGGGKRG